MAQPQSTRKSPSLITKTFWLSVLAGFLLLISNSAIWVNNYIFDEENFSNVVTTAVTSESSRQAIAERVTNEAFKDRPVLKKVAGDLTTKVVSGLLGTSQAENAVDEVVSRLNVLVTSNDPQPVVLDLSGVKNIVTQLVNVSVEAGREPKVDPNNIPSQITILDTDSLPNFYKASVAFLWLAPLTFIGALAALIAPYFKRERQFKPMLLTQGVVLTATGLFGLLIGPLFRPPLLSNVPTSQGRVVVGNIYDGFIATFNTQTWYLIAFGLAVTVFAGALYAYQVIAPAVKNYSQKRSTKSSTKK